MNRCIACSTETTNPMFCSKSCAAKTNNKIPGRAKPGPKSTLKSKACLFCKAEFVSENKHFCSKACEVGSRNEVTALRFEKGELLSDSTAKRLLIEQRGNVCSNDECRNQGVHCGKPLTLQLDHIDGNSDNNSPDNLRLLCPNCHSQTPTFCFKGKTHKTTKRNRATRERYKFQR